MEITQYLGASSSLQGTDENAQGNLYYILWLDGASLQNPTLGRLTDINIDDTQSEKLLTAILNVLYERTKDKVADPNYSIVGSSLYQGRESIGLENPVLMDTYNLTFQIRLPSSSGSMPDPDDL